MKKNSILPFNLPTTCVGGLLSLLGVFGVSPAQAQTPTIRDSNDTGSVVRVTEGDSGTSNATFRLTIPSVQQNDVTYFVSTASGTAAAGSDFQPRTNLPVVVRAGTTSSIFTVAVIGDTVFESPREEQFTVFASLTSGGASAGTPGTGVITDNDPAPTVSIQQFPSPVREGASSNIPVAISLSAASASDITVDYTVSSPGGEGFASPGNDYTIPANLRVTIPAGTLNTAVNIPIINDLQDETAEDFFVDLVANSARTVGGDTLAITSSRATLTINDNDGPTVRVSETATANEGENARFIVTLVNTGNSNTNAETINIPYTLTSGSATAGADFSATSGTLQILAGGTTGEILIPTFADDLVESNETFTLTLTGGGAAGNFSYFFEDASNNFQSASATATIVDDVRPRVRFTTTSQSFPEGSTTTGVNYSVTVTLEGRMTGNVSVPFTFQSGNGANSAVNSVGAAQGANADYRGVNDTLEFLQDSATSRSQTIGFTVLSDTIAEPDESFRIVLGQPVNARLGASGTETFTAIIPANDQNPTITVVNPNETVVEGAAGTTRGGFIRFNLSAPAPRPISIQYQVIEGTATASGPGVTRADYNFTGTQNGTNTGTLVIEAGLTTKAFTPLFTITGDAIYESGETVVIQVNSATNAVLDPSDDTKTFTIANDDAQPRVSIQAVNARVTEGNSGNPSYDFLITLDRESQLPVTVNYLTQDGTATAFVAPPPPPTPAPTPAAGATPAPTATPVPTPAVGSGDYISTGASSLDFNSYIVSQNISVSLIGDTIVEPDENFRVNLTGATNATINTAAQFATGVIANDDAQPVLSLSTTATSSQTEGTDTQAGAPTKPFNFTVSQSAISSSAVTFNYTLVGPTTVGFADSDRSNSNNATGVIPAGAQSATITVNVVQDDIFESTEFFELRLISAVGASIATEPGSRLATGTIVNDDEAPTVTITAPTTALNELSNPVNSLRGTSVIFPVRLSKAVGRVIRVNYGVNFPADGANSADFVGATSGTLTFSPGRVAPDVELTLTAARDGVDETDEAYSVSLISADIAIAETVVANSTIVDETSTTVSLSVSPGFSANASEIVSGSVEPRDSARFRVTLAAAIQRDVVLRWTVSGRGANPASSTDFSLSTGLVTIPARSTFAEFSVRARSDVATVDNVDEDYTVRIEEVPGTTTDYVLNANGGLAGTPLSLDGTIFDRSTSYENFPDDVGFATFTPQGLAPVIGDEVIITGDQFRIPGLVGTKTDGTPLTDRVLAVIFGVNNPARPGGVVQTSSIRYVNDDSIAVRVPAGAKSGRIYVRILDVGQRDTNRFITLLPQEAGFDNTFYVQPTITNVTPRRGLPGVTQVVVEGVNFLDALNPITQISFGGGILRVEDGIDIQSDTRLVVTTPTNAQSGPVNIFSEYGGQSPTSGLSYILDTFIPGSLRFVGTETGTEIGRLRYLIEGQRGTFNQPVKKMALQLRPARQVGANGVQTDIVPLFPITVDISIAPPGNGNEARAPIISTNFGGTIRSGTLLRVVIPSGEAGLNAIIPIHITDAGSDSVGAQLVANGAVLKGITDDRGYDYDVREQTLPTVSVTAQITRDTRPAGAPNLYPVSTQATQAQANFPRYDIHNIVTNSIFTKYETFEDSGLARIPARRLDLTKSLDPNTVEGETNVGSPERAGNTTVFRVDLANLYAPNTDGSANTEAHPRTDVQLAVRSLDETEGRLSYYVINRNTGVAEAIQPNLQQGAPVQVRFSTNPSDREYFLNQHIILVTGIDDQEQDGDIPFSISVSNPLGNGDTEYLTTRFETQNVAFNVVNRDNEQAVDPVGGTPTAGFLFTGPTTAAGNILLQTSEDGSSSRFSVRLRTAPVAGRVVLMLRTSEPDEALLVDPADGRPKEQIVVAFYRTQEAGFNAAQSVWNRNINITVVGRDDRELEGGGSTPPVGTPFTILTSINRPLTLDRVYAGLDPQDLAGQNADNERIGFTVSPSNVVVSEGSTGTFGIRLTSAPTANVTINLQSSDLNVATLVSPSTLVFTPATWFTLQTVTVRGVRDGMTTPAIRTATITTLNSASSDVNYDNKDVPDVTVQVQNVDQPNTNAGVTVTPTALNVNEGATRTFTVQLNTPPSSDVTIPISSSDTRAVRVSAGLVTFTSANFNTPQTITLTGISDGVSTPEQRTATVVLGAATSADTRYSGFNPTDVSVVVFNTDGATPGVRVSPTSIVADELDNTSDSANTNEATFTIRLLSQPTDNVTINLFSTDTSVARVSKVNGVVASRVVFTPANWSVQQTVTVTGVPDGRLTPTRNAVISTSAAISSDVDYSGLAVPDVTVQILNTETLVRVSKQTVATSESGTTDSFGVTLASAPAQNVTVTIRSDVTAEALFVVGSSRVSSVSLTFTPANFSTAQTVVVAGVRDNINDGTQPYTLSGTVTSTDGNFNGAEFPQIAGTNSNIDTGGTNGGTSFQPNGSYLISTPYASNNTAGTITVAQAFGPTTVSGGAVYDLYRFLPETQTGAIFNTTTTLPASDWKRLVDTDLIRRGEGLLLVTKDTTVTLRTTGFAVSSATQFKIRLYRNRNYRRDVGTTEERNGFNAIGFPFSPTFTQASFLDAQVEVFRPSTNTTTTYTVQQAASLGIINNQLFTLDGNRRVTPVGSGQNFIELYKGYFVQLFDEDTNLDGVVSTSERRDVTLVLRNPTS